MCHASPEAQAVLLSCRPFRSTDQLFASIRMSMCTSRGANLGLWPGLGCSWRACTSPDPLQLGQCVWQSRLEGYQTSHMNSQKGWNQEQDTNKRTPNNVNPSQCTEKVQRNSRTEASFAPRFHRSDIGEHVSVLLQLGVGCYLPEWLVFMQEQIQILRTMHCVQRPIGDSSEMAGHCMALTHVHVHLMHGMQYN